MTHSPKRRLARAAKAKAIPKRAPTTFFSLPGELRNRIYDLVVPELRILIERKRPLKDEAFRGMSPIQRGAYLKVLSPERHRKLHQTWLHCQIDPVFGERTKTIRDLLHVSSQMTSEVIPILYSKTLFCFNSIKVLNRFLDKGPALGIHHMTKLELCLQNYGEPELTDMREWKFIADSKWLNTCYRIAETMPQLRILRLDLTIADWPTYLSLDARWVRPLLVLKKGGLHLVEAIIRHSNFSEQKLEAFSHELADFMMTRDGVRVFERKQEVKRQAKQLALWKEEKALRMLKMA